MKQLLLVFVLFLILFKFSSSAKIDGVFDTEYNCAKNLVAKLGLTNFFPSSVLCYQNLNCEDGTIPCGLGIKCDTTKAIVTDISLKNIIAASVLKSSDLNCFTNISSLTLLSAGLESTFLSTLTSVTSLTLNDSTSLSTIDNTINSNIKELNIQISKPFTSNLKLSYLLNINNIQIITPITNSDNVNINLDNNIVSGVKSFNKFQVISNNLPNLNNIVIKDLTIAFGSLFNNNFENSTTFINIENLKLQSSKSVVYKFPSQLNTGGSTSQLKQLTIDYKVSPVVSPIDFSSFQNIDSISLINIGNEFKGPNGEFPFKSLPSNLETFNFNGGVTLGLFNFSQLSNIGNVLISSSNLVGNLPKFMGNNIGFVDLSSNAITGTIDNSWCNVGSGGLNVVNNQLSGTLPTCFSCVYNKLSKFQAQFAYNSQLVLPTSSSVCSTLIPSIKIENGTTVLYGTDLGFDTIYFTSVPSLSWKIDKPNSVFYVDEYVEPTNFTFTFTAVPLEQYQLSTVVSYPIVKSYQIVPFSGGSSDKAIVTFKGEFFTYNSVDITILFGDSNDYGHCQVTKSSFTKIECTIENYQALFSTLATSSFSDGTYIKTVVTVNGRKSTQIMVDLNIGTGEKPGNMCGNESCSYFEIDGNEGVIGDHGVCDKTGTCKCSYKVVPSGPNWSNTNCAQPYHYITSLIPTNQFGGVIEINGWFSNLHQNLKISVNGTIVCEPIAISSSQIKCRIDKGAIGIGHLILTQNQMTTYTAFTFIATCPNQCSGNGVCRSTTGECACDSSFQGLDCSIPYIGCPLDCSTQTSIGNGNSCNNQTGICTCFDNRYTPSSGCSIPNHYCSSSNKVSSSTGGIVSLFGWYGQVREGLTVVIGNVPCPIINSTSSLVNCEIPSGTGVKSINITQNSISWFGKDKFQYYNEIKSCAQCLNGGTCNTGTGNCICTDKYTGYDCSALTITPTTNSTSNSTTTEPSAPPKSENAIDKTDGTVSINNEQTKYNLLIKSLIEVDLNGSPVYSYDLVNKWILNQVIDNENSTTYIFHQSINNVNNQNNNTLLISTIQEIKKSKTIEFATVELHLDVNSIKVSIEISNYKYSSNLNTLQLLFESSVKDTNVDGEDTIGNNCNDENTLVTETNLNDVGLNYLKIEKNGKIMMGRFVNYALSDGRPTFITSNIVSSADKDSITISLNLPHSSSIIIDPDFSVLVSPNYISNCDESSNSKPSWFLPVVIVVPVIGCAALTVAAITIFKKNSVSLKIKMNRLKSFKSRN